MGEPQRQRGEPQRASEVTRKVSEAAGRASEAARRDAEVAGRAATGRGGGNDKENEDRKRTEKIFAQFIIYHRSSSCTEPLPKN